MRREDLAAKSLFVALAMLMWAYDILLIEGRKYDTKRFNIRPKKFECIVRVRSEAHRRMLKRENAETESKFGLRSLRCFGVSNESKESKAER